jgi:predicted phosphodiesterase
MTQYRAMAQSTLCLACPKNPSATIAGQPLHRSRGRLRRDSLLSWAFLSDVHGNASALDRAIQACRRLGAQRYAFLGDLLGRGDSDACVRRIRELASISVQGNRDVDWSSRVSDEVRAYVLGLPRSGQADDFVCAHGDPRVHRPLDVADIRQGGRRSYAWILGQGARIGFFGHTHRAQVWRKRGHDSLLEDITADHVPVDDELPTVYFVNVGTVGMPFGGKGPPSCTLYDGNSVRLVRF